MLESLQFALMASAVFVMGMAILNGANTDQTKAVIVWALFVALSNLLPFYPYTVRPNHVVVLVNNNNKRRLKLDAGTHWINPFEWQELTWRQNKDITLVQIPTQRVYFDIVDQCHASKDNLDVGMRIHIGIEFEHPELNNTSCIESSLAMMTSATVPAITKKYDAMDAIFNNGLDVEKKFVLDEFNAYMKQCNIGIRVCEVNFVDTEFNDEECEKAVSESNAKHLKQILSAAE